MAPQNDSDNSGTDIDWDGSPLTRASWYSVLPTAQAITRFRPFWTSGIVAAKGKTFVYTSSREHSYQLTIGNLERCTFEKPFDPEKLKLKDPSKTYTRSLSSQKGQPLRRRVGQSPRSTTQPHTSRTDTSSTSRTANSTTSSRRKSPTPRWSTTSKNSPIASDFPS